MHDDGAPLPSRNVSDERRANDTTRRRRRLQMCKPDESDEASTSVWRAPPHTPRSASAATMRADRSNETAVERQSLLVAVQTPSLSLADIRSTTRFVVVALPRRAARSCFKFWQLERRSLRSLRHDERRQRSQRADRRGRRASDRVRRLFELRRVGRSAAPQVDAHANRRRRLEGRYRLKRRRSTSPFISRHAHIMKIKTIKHFFYCQLSVRISANRS